MRTHNKYGNLWVGWSRGCGPIGRPGERERADSPVDSAQESADTQAVAQEGAISRRLFTIASTGDNKKELATNKNLTEATFVDLEGGETSDDDNCDD